MAVRFQPRFGAAISFGSVFLASCVVYDMYHSSSDKMDLGLLSKALQLSVLTFFVWFDGYKSVSSTLEHDCYTKSSSSFLV